MRLHPGVYAVGHWALTAESRDLAAVLACGRGALLSHRAAGARHGLLRGSGGRLEVTAPRGCKPKRGIVIHTARAIHPDDRYEVAGIPITSVARTIVDLAASDLPDRRLTAVVNEAEVRRVLDVAAIERALRRRPGARGSQRLRAALAAYTEAPGYSESEAEHLLRRLCQEHNLPQPGRVFLHGYELDFYWPDSRLAIEVDGLAFHSTSRAFQEDRRRDRWRPSSRPFAVGA